MAADDEITLAELARTLRRIESNFASFVLKAVYEAEMVAMRDRHDDMRRDIEEIQDTRKTYTRLLTGAILTALVPSLILLFRIKAPA